jgi:hypothetical protein
MLGCKVLLPFLVLVLGTAAGASSAGCPFAIDEPTRITNSPGASQTARGNGRCVAVDAQGTTHLVWEDQRDGNFEIYYASFAGTRSPEIRITATAENSNFPCVACEGDKVYILWQEKVKGTSQIFYVCLAGGKEIARKQLSDAPIGAECPATAVGPDRTLHVAWHQGVGAMTTIHYGRVVNHVLESHTPICTQHPAAFRPDIACDAAGRILIAWYEGADVKSRFWDGTAWQDELLVAHDTRQSWRLSVTSLSEGKWVLAWFDQAPKTTDVWAAFFDGKAWSGQTRVNLGQTGFYPATASYGPGRALVVWEDQDKPKGEYLLMMRCFDGRAWGTPTEIARGRAMSRYASLAPSGDLMHVVWFGMASGDNEIYHCLLRRQ